MKIASQALLLVLLNVVTAAAATTFKAPSSSSSPENAPIALPIDTKHRSGSEAGDDSKGNGEGGDSTDLSLYKLPHLKQVSAVDGASSSTADAVVDGGIDFDDDGDDDDDEYERHFSKTVESLNDDDEFTVDERRELAQSSKCKSKCRPRGKKKKNAQQCVSLW